MRVLHRRFAVALGEFSQGVLDVLLGEHIVVVTVEDEFAAERPELVAMPAEGCLGQTLVRQMDQERREHLNDLSAHDDVCGRYLPGSGPVVQVRAGLAQALREPRIETERALKPVTGVVHVARTVAQYLPPLPGFVYAAVRLVEATSTI